jgi:hypothetical protein
VEHPCYKCQTSIDEVLPFCPHCGAPQIRVSSPEEEVAQAAPLTPDTPQVMPPASWTPAPTYHPQAVQWEAAWQGAILSGLIAAVLSAAPVISMGCCLWLLGAGAMSVFLYQRRVPASLVTPGMGMRIGAFSGVVGFVASTFWLVFQFARNSQEFRRALQEQMEKSIGSNPDPRAQDIMRQFMNNLNTPQGLATFFVLMLVVIAITFIIFSAAGGAIGAAMFARRRDVR